MVVQCYASAIFITETYDQQTKCRKDNEKKRSERRKHCALAVVTRSQKNFAPPQTPFPWRRTAKILSAGDGYYLHLQTQIGEDRCMQF